MGLFDFLKSERRAVEKFFNSPEVRRATVATEVEFAEKQCANLRAVGRHEEADKVTVECLNKLLHEWKRDPQDTW